jgi:hypothetical protein
VTDVWEAVVGQPPTRDQVLEMNQHPKIAELARFDQYRLAMSAPEAVSEDGIDIDAWVAAAVHRALAGPRREGAGSEVMYSFHPEGRPGPGVAPPRDYRLALGLTIVLVVVFALVVWLNTGGGTSKPASNGMTAVVERNGDGRTDDEIVAQVRKDFCGQGYAGIELTITRTQVRNASGGVAQQAGVSTFLQKC